MEAGLPYNKGARSPGAQTVRLEAAGPVSDCFAAKLTGRFFGNVFSKAVY